MLSEYKYFLSLELCKHITWIDQQKIAFRMTFAINKIDGSKEHKVDLPLLWASIWQEASIPHVTARRLLAS
jgi:hypothetical protein